jgi:hypothetical protein
MVYNRGGVWYSNSGVRLSNTAQVRLGLSGGRTQGQPIAPPADNTYAPPFSGVKRHSVLFNNTSSFAAPLASDAHVILAMLLFKRTFSGTTSDIDDTPAASNNYPTTAVFNGDRIENYHAKLSFQGTESTPRLLDVYEIAVSFWDVQTWLANFPTRCPLLFDTAAGPPDTRGQVTIDGAKAATGFRLADFKSYRFLQQYLKYKGTILIGPVADSTTNVELNINSLPPKCRRANSGMFYGLLFHNNPDKNNNQSMAVRNTNEVSFEAIPSDRRMPFLS